MKKIYEIFIDMNKQQDQIDAENLRQCQAIYDAIINILSAVDSYKEEDISHRDMVDAFKSIFRYESFGEAVIKPPHWLYAKAALKPILEREDKAYRLNHWAKRKVHALLDAWKIIDEQTENAHDLLVEYSGRYHLPSRIGLSEFQRFGEDGNLLSGLQPKKQHEIFRSMFLN